VSYKGKKAVKEEVIMTHDSSNSPCQEPSRNSSSELSFQHRPVAPESTFDRLLAQGKAGKLSLGKSKSAGLLWPQSPLDSSPSEVVSLSASSDVGENGKEEEDSSSPKLLFASPCARVEDVQERKSRKPRARRPPGDRLAPAQRDRIFSDETINFRAQWGVKCPSTGNILPVDERGRVVQPPVEASRPVTPATRESRILSAQGANLSVVSEMDASFALVDEAKRQSSAAPPTNYVTSTPLPAEDKVADYRVMIRRQEQPPSRHPAPVFGAESIHDCLSELSFPTNMEVKEDDDDKENGVGQHGLFSSPLAVDATAEDLFNESRKEPGRQPRKTVRIGLDTPEVKILSPEVSLSSPIPALVGAKGGKKWRRTLFTGAGALKERRTTVRIKLAPTARVSFCFRF